MKYNKVITLKDGRSCILRNGTALDGQALLNIFLLTHAQTDYLLSYPDESTMTVEQEMQFLKEAPGRVWNQCGQSLLGPWHRSGFDGRLH